MKHFGLIGAGTVAGLLLLGGAAGATGYTVQTVQYPGDPTFTQLLGINNAGTIGGFHGAATAQGFTLTLPNTYTTENFPGSSMSMVTGLNGFGSLSGIYVDGGGTTHGFDKISGVFHTLDQPGTAFNQALGINNTNVTVGYSSTDPAGAVLQQAYSQSGGFFANINALLPANLNSQAVGINNAGNIVGFYLPASGPIASIGFQDIGGLISGIDPFASTNTQALGISNTGEVVGFWTDGLGVQHGYTRIGGVFSSFDPVGSLNTTINGVNDLGQLVGFYTDVNDNVIGFVATPVPEPAALAVLGAGLLGLLMARRQQGRIAFST